MRLFVSDSHDVFANLAFEESLMREEGESAFLWVNDPCVVIGRNQNPYYEADVAYLDAHGIALARRLTGGGAVYHDAGNLCYSVVTDNPLADAAAEWALSTLEYLGIHAELGGRNDIMVGQAKVGGLAERFDGRYLKHGTLLVNVDLSALENALRPSPLKASVAFLGNKVVENRIDCIVPIPSLRRPRLVPDFAKSLATTFGIPCIEAIGKTCECAEQKALLNSAQQEKNIRESTAVINGEAIVGKTVLLVDDMVDSRWTFTVVAAELMDAGAACVYPYALVKTGGAD